MKTFIVKGFLGSDCKSWDFVFEKETQAHFELSKYDAVELVGPSKKIKGIRIYEKIPDGEPKHILCFEVDPIRKQLEEAEFQMNEVFKKQEETKKFWEEADINDVWLIDVELHVADQTFHCSTIVHAKSKEEALMKFDKLEKQHPEQDGYHEQIKMMCGRLVDNLHLLQEY